MCYASARYIEEPFTNLYMDASASITCPPTYSVIYAEQTCRRVYVPLECPEGQEEFNGECVPVCPAGSTRINGVCTSNGCPAAGTSAGPYTTDSDSTAYTCETYNGRACTIKIEPTICVRYEQDGRTYSSCHGDGKFTGGSCWGGGDGGGTTPGGSPGDPDPTPDPNPYPDPSPSNPGGPGAPDQGTGTPTPSPGPAPPPPQPQPEEPDGSCPAGTSRINGECIKNPESPGPTGSCPSGSVRVGEQCVYTSSPGDGSSSGGTPGGGGDGDADGDCEPGSTLLKCSTMGGLPGGDGINRSTRNMTFAPDNAMATTGACPASVTIPLLGTTLTVVDMVEACDLISTYVRPIAILLSAFMALGIAAGVLKTET